jgi:hypothetical protein
MAEQQKFPSEVIDLPSQGKFYPEEHPCSSGKIEIKYMTAKEEDILTSQNLIKKGVVIDKLLQSLIIDKSINIDDLLLGDKNAVMVASRVLAYGPDYSCEVTNPNTAEKFKHTFNLTECPFVYAPEDIKENLFEVTLPVSKKKIEFKLLTGHEEKLINRDLKASKKTGSQVSPELTTRLRYLIHSVEGDSSALVVNDFSKNILSRDSLYLRTEIQSVSPDINLRQDVEIEGELVEVVIPLTVNFFWPTAKG